MNFQPQTPRALKQFLKKEGLWAKKSLGQHFLLDTEVVKTAVEAAKLAPVEQVVEIGPGLGFLTEKLLETKAKVLAIEKDEKLAQLLKKRITHPNLEVLAADALQAVPRLGFNRYKVVANLPYAIASPVVRILIGAKNSPQLLVLMVQKEQAQRLTAPAGSRQRGILTVLLESFGQAEIIRVVPQEAFWPPPKVESAILKITKAPQAVQVKPSLLTLLKTAFGHKRRMLKNALKGFQGLEQHTLEQLLEKAQVSGRARAEDLSLGQWGEIARLFQEFQIKKG